VFDTMPDAKMSDRRRKKDRIVRVRMRGSLALRNSKEDEWEQMLPEIEFPGKLLGSPPEEADWRIQSKSAMRAPVWPL
jgi:hypothetical protein